MRKRLHSERRDFKKTKKLIQAGKAPRNYEPLKKGEPAKSQNSLLDGTELFSKFTADIIKEDVLFTR